MTDESAWVRGFRNWLRWLESWQFVLLGIVIPVAAGIISAATISETTSTLNAVTHAGVISLLFMLCVISASAVVHLGHLALRRQRDEERATRRQIELVRVDYDDKLLLGLTLLDVRVGVRLRNASPGPLRYEIETMSVTIGGRANPTPAFANHGGLLAVGETTTFRYDWVRDLDETTDVYGGVVEYVAKYGHPLHPWSYRSRRKFQLTVGQLLGGPRHGNADHTMLEEAEEKITQQER